MSAVELMDKKMDQCFGLQGSIQNEELLTPSVPEGGFDMDAVLNILQILVVYEAGFLDGASVLESTHNCIYMWEGSWDKLQSTEGFSQRVILAYCRSLHQSLRYYTKLVLDVDIFEDEDFQGQLLPMLGDSLLECDISGELEGLIEELGAGAVPGLEESTRREVVSLLQSRLSFNELILTVETCTEMTLRMATGKRKRGEMPVEEDQYYLREHWQRADAKLIRTSTFLEEIESIVKGNNSSEDKAEEEVYGKTDNNGDGLTVISDRTLSPGASTAFSPVVCKLAQNGPIRHVPLKPYVQSLGTMKKCVQELSHVRSIIVEVDTRSDGITNTNLGTIIADSEGKCNGVDFEYLFEVVHDCADRHFHLLPRCILCSYLNYLTSVDLEEFHIPNSMRRKGVPSVLSQGALVQNEWIPGSLGQLYYETLKMMCTHRNKMIAKSEGVLGSFAHVVDEARYLDEKFRKEAGIPDEGQIWCTNWCLTTVMRIMILHWRLLSECELLAACELDCYYFYGEYLFGFRVAIEETIAGMSHRMSQINYQDTLLELQQKEEAAAKANRKGVNMENLRKLLMAVPAPIAPDFNKSPSMLTIIGERDLCRGLARTAVAMSGPGLRATNATKLENPHCSWKTRFQKRFQGLSKFAIPPPLTFQQYKDSFLFVMESDSESGETVDAISKSIEDHDDTAMTKYVLQDAGKHLTNAKNAFSRIRLLSKPGEKGVNGGKSGEETQKDDLEAKICSKAASERMRVALTCWANTNKLVNAIAEGEEPRRRMTVNSSLSPHYVTIGIE
jgi:hypothetical protein